MILIIINKPWARSSVGRAPRSQRGGHQSDSGRVHHICLFTSMENRGF